MTFLRGSQKALPSIFLAISLAGLPFGLIATLVAGALAPFLVLFCILDVKLRSECVLLVSCVVLGFLGMKLCVAACRKLIRGTIHRSHGLWFAQSLYNVVMLFFWPMLEDERMLPSWDIFDKPALVLWFAILTMIAATLTLLSGLPASEVEYSFVPPQQPEEDFLAAG